MSFFDIKQPSWTNSPASFLGEPFFSNWCSGFRSWHPWLTHFFGWKPVSHHKGWKANSLVVQMGEISYLSEASLWTFVLGIMMSNTQRVQENQQLYMVCVFFTFLLICLCFFGSSNTWNFTWKVQETQKAERVRWGWNCSAAGRNMTVGVSEFLFMAVPG